MTVSGDGGTVLLRRRPALHHHAAFPAHHPAHHPAVVWHPFQSHFLPMPTPRPMLVHMQPPPVDHFAFDAHAHARGSRTPSPPVDRFAFDAHAHAGGRGSRTPSPPSSPVGQLAFTSHVQCAPQPPVQVDVRDLWELNQPDETPPPPHPVVTIDTAVPGALHAAPRQLWGPAQVEVRDVWKWNLAEEMAAITSLLPTHPVVTIDTEFPGAVHDSATPRDQRSPKEAYALVRSNVDHLKHLLQLGLTLSGPGGSHPVVWQFNFRGFDEGRHPHAPESIAMLKAHGMDFGRLREDGIDPGDFADEFMRSGLNHRRPRRGKAAQEPLTWVAFSGSYDFAYLAKLLRRGRGLPQKLEHFTRLVEKLFGQWVLDARYIATTCGSHGGLEKVAAELGVQRRAGVAHSAGSDSLLTADVMLAIVLCLEGPPNYQDVRRIHAGKIDGLVKLDLQTCKDVTPVLYCFK
ncbi:putative CCR4-associated factor 1-11-like protein [Hordeum vulgare]|nr:putative CCR4-associated factor 1-11-like protein [Hordeum vulgare]KAI4973709.1 hypothetical protein ZWY2020_041490 [Hordeum vulgare]